MFQFFFFNDTATTEIYTLSLHDALPISQTGAGASGAAANNAALVSQINSFGNTSVNQNGTNLTVIVDQRSNFATARSEEHTSELQSRQYLVCRLLLEKKIN